jgi:glutaredoxin
VELIVLTQPSCGFCDAAKELAARLAAEYALSTRELSLTDGEGRVLAERTGVLFAPGILLDGELLAYGRPSERRIRRELDRRLPRSVA